MLLHVPLINPVSLKFPFKFQEKETELAKLLVTKYCEDTPNAEPLRGVLTSGC